MKYSCKISMGSFAKKTRKPLHEALILTFYKGRHLCNCNWKNLCNSVSVVRRDRRVLGWWNVYWYYGKWISGLMVRINVIWLYLISYAFLSFYTPWNIRRLEVFCFIFRGYGKRPVAWKRLKRLKLAL